MISELSVSDALHPFNSTSLDDLIFHVITTRNDEFYAGTHEELTVLPDLPTDEIIALFMEAWEKDMTEKDGQRTYAAWKLSRRFQLSDYDRDAILHLSNMALRDVYEKSGKVLRV